MNRSKRFFKLFFVIVLVILTGAYFLVRNIATSGLPDYNSEIIIDGLKDEVIVYRDSFAIPHIYAKNELDMYMATGYVMAQDRMWQMDLIRRATQGRLSEIFGEDFVKTDQLLRSLRIGEKSKRMLNECTEEKCRMVEAFTRGVNMYLEQNNHKLPPEFAILNYEPDKWEAEHTLNAVGYMAWDLAGGNYSIETLLYKIIQELGQEKASLLIPEYSSKKAVVYPGFDLKESLLNDETSLLEADKRLDDLGLKVFLGSNNWAVSGAKSETGMPLMANDMHLGLSAPGIWYQIHQVVEGKLNVTGLVVPGAPFIVAGHNENIAWGMTNISVDDIDLYLEKINPENPNEYFFMGKWTGMKVREEVIHIKGGDSVVVTNRFTHRGPIVSGFKDIEQSISMRWMGYEYGNACLTICELNRAKNWNEFKEALKSFTDLGQNIVYADIEGNIGMYAAGGLPIREGEAYLVKPGQTDKYDWKGIVPFEEMPHEYNPERAYVASANNKSVDENYPYYIGSRFAQGYRYRRIVQMLEEKEKLSIDDFKKMQADQNSLMPASFLPDILDVLNISELNSVEEQGLQLLNEWDANYGSGSAAALIFESLYHKLLVNIISDDLSDDLFEEYRANKTFVRGFMENFWDKKDPLWCDDVSTENIKEDFADIVLKSYKQVINDLAEQNGDEVASWQWGNIHQFTMAHPLGKVKLLDRVFSLNRGPYPVGGSFHTVSPYSYSFADPYSANHGASHRHIFDLADWDRSQTIIPTGESGIPASKHYLDQLDMYLNYEYHADPFSKDELMKRVRYTGKFLPQAK